MWHEHYGHSLGCVLFALFLLMAMASELYT